MDSLKFFMDPWLGTAALVDDMKEACGNEVKTERKL